MRTSITLSALAGILFLESVLLAVVSTWFVVEFFVATPHSVAGALMIIALTSAAAVWVFVIAIHALRARPWIRAAAITWQVLQVAVALGLFQGTFARADIGWGLMVPAIGALILLFLPSVVAATKRAS